MDDSDDSALTTGGAAGGAAGVPVLSRLAFALALIGLGTLAWVRGAFSPIWVPVPRGVPAREAIVYLCALVSLGSGIGLLWNRTATLASRVLAAYLVAWLLLLRVPHIFLSPSVGVIWAAGKIAVMAAAAWVLSVGFAGHRNGPGPGVATGETGLRLARALYGLALVPFGIAHFTYLERTTAMVPGWLPAHQAWAIFTGCALIAAGAAAIFGVLPRLAVVLSAWEIGLFTLLVWGPVLAAGPKAPSQWSEIIVSTALTTAAWVVATSYRGLPWLAVGSR